MPGDWQNGRPKNEYRSIKFFQTFDNPCPAQHISVKPYKISQIPYKSDKFEIKHNSPLSKIVENLCNIDYACKKPSSSQ